MEISNKNGKKFTIIISILCFIAATVSLIVNILIFKEIGLFSFIGPIAFLVLGIMVIVYYFRILKSTEEKPEKESVISKLNILDDKNIVKIKDSNISFRIMLIIMFIACFTIIPLILWFRGILDFPFLIGFLIGSLLFLGCLLGADTRFAVLNHNGIEFYLKKELVFSCLWSELKQINIQTEWVHYPREYKIKEPNSELKQHQVPAF